MEDREIVDLFFARDEQAIVQARRKYGEYCYSIASRILNNHEDSEETINDMLLHAWNSIPPQSPQILKLFLAKITRNLAFSRWRKSAAMKRGGGEITLVLEELEGCVSSAECVDDQLNAKELAGVISKFLETLPKRDHDIFLQRYFYMDDANTIAARYGMKRSNVNLILSRTRKRLKTYLMKEGYYL